MTKLIYKAFIFAFIAISSSVYADQLDMLWHDIDEGRIPGKETSLWYAHVKDVKEQHPKP